MNNVPTECEGCVADVTREQHVVCHHDFDVSDAALLMTEVPEEEEVLNEFKDKESVMLRHNKQKGV